MSYTRRTTLKALLAAAAGAAASPYTFAGFDTTQTRKRLIPWKNWAGNQSCQPKLKASPKNLDELSSVLKNSVGTVRAVGSGHSWSGLVPTDDTILSLRRFKGLMENEGQLVRFGAGTKLSSLGPILDDLGLAMPNMPDIDEQTLAGAFATGTHGSGLALPALHENIQSLRLMKANGDLIECSREKNAEIFEAARVSLGALGIITDYQLKVDPSYKVERKHWLEDLDSILGRGEELAQKYRHFEFFYIPFSDQSYCFTTDITDKPITGVQADDPDAIDNIKNLRDMFSWNNGIRRLATKGLLKTIDLPKDFVDLPWKTLANDRVTPIYEMEYQLPLEAGPAAMREVVDYIENNHPEFFVPMEYRYVGADEAWMSEFYQRPSVSISVHRYREGDDPWNVFTKVREIFTKYGGRPHWGKVHDLKYEELKDLYPKFEDFRTIRQELDPGGKFLNKHLRTLLGVHS